jgi:hypothetical protein
MIQSVLNLFGTKPTDDWGRATLNRRRVLTCASAMRKRYAQAIFTFWTTLVLLWHVFCWSQTCVPFQIWQCATLTCVTDSMKQSPSREAKTSSTLSWSRNSLLFMESISSLTCPKMPPSVPITSHANPAQCILTTYCHIILQCIWSY